ncbi:MAG: flagellar P-ring protein precursor FlgI [Alphaproteobacteria bacterium]|jgi:flagellar P-ring protein precursor FlgI
MKKMIRFFTTTVMICLMAGSSFASNPVSRIKDIADFEGVRSNILIGYGLVVGLNGTGDSANSIPFTRQTLINMLEKLGVNAKAAEAQIKTKNVAAVMITSNMPSYARQGSKIDITASSLGDAKSLEGGQLLATPLIAADGQTYAIAQGPVVIGGFTTTGRAGTVTKNHPTSGHIAGGATIEMETGHELSDSKRLRIILRNPDFTTALRLKDAINKTFNEPIAKALDNQTIDIAVPLALRDNLVPIIHKIENTYVRPDAAAKIIINEKTGTVVMGAGVQISDVAISHANLNIRVTELTDIIQPDGFSDGITAAVPATAIEVDEETAKFHVIDSGANLADLVDGLNALGVSPRDIISILQTIKSAGALQAEIVIM